MTPVQTPTDEWLRDLIAALATDDAIAFALTGSYARGEATPYSDVDILRFTRALPATAHERYTLLRRDGRLVSLSTTTIAAKRAELAEPENACFAVPGLRQMRILDDPTGALHDLQREAEAFTWEPLRAAADLRVSETVMGIAEEVHKVLGALLRRDESAAAYGTLGLVMGLTRAMVVHRRLLIRSENTYFAQAQEAVGRNSAWTRVFRLAAGLDVDANASMRDQTRAEARALAGLSLYRETVALTRDVLPAHHLPAVEAALAAIADSGHTIPA
jgi:predicted nucleotidyltransferase